jgi:hypothetical protein
LPRNNFNLSHYQENDVQALKRFKLSLQTLAIAVVVMAGCVIMALTGCASTASTTTAQNAATTAAASATLQAQLSSFCAVAPAEVQAFVAGEAALSATAQQALPAVQAFVNGSCAAGVVANATTLQNFIQSVLPAFTTIALEYAATKK